MGKNKDQDKAKEDKGQGDSKQDKKCCDSVLHMYGDPMDSERD